ncbi:MAG: hypothetical protein HPY69_02015 [Armatimonadetes bacterium]|nr:hypothetical protein [Armatimonadota bacterium]
MLHEPAAQAGEDRAASYKASLGVWMFVFYSLFYAGFVWVNLSNPTAMEAEWLMGLNGATVYGFALIIVALIQALIYDVLCRAREHALSNQSRDTSEG